MKKLFLLIASLFLTVSVANANPIQNDLDLAFGGSVKAQQITLLDNLQMSEVKGKGWFKKLRKSISKPFKKAGRAIGWNKRRYIFFAQFTVFTGNPYIYGAAMSYGSYRYYNP
jgi:hypothetical protein